MTKPPLVSIVIPTFHRPEMLQRALSTVREQTYKNIEVLVVDDNGVDSANQKLTEEVVNKARMNIPNIKYLVHDCNMGGAAARNTGLSACKGEFVAFLDDDDEILPAKVEKQVALFESKGPKLALVYAFTISVDESGRTRIYSHRFSGNCLYDQLRLGCIAATSQWLCRTAILKKVGGFTLSSAKQDSILMLKLLSSGYEIDYVPEILSVFNDHSGSRMSNSGKELSGEIQYWTYAKKEYWRLSSSQVNEIERCFCIRLSKLYAKDRKLLSMGRYLIRAFAISPPKTGSEVAHILLRKTKMLGYKLHVFNDSLARKKL